MSRSRAGPELARRFFTIRFRILDRTIDSPATYNIRLLNFEYCSLATILQNRSRSPVPPTAVHKHQVTL